MLGISAVKLFYEVGMDESMFSGNQLTMLKCFGREVWLLNYSLVFFLYSTPYKSLYFRE